MQHLDPESLSLLALGEELGDDAADHLRSCAGCAADFAGLRRAVVAAKPGPDAVALEAPGPSAVIAMLRSWILLLGILWVLDALLGGDGIWYTLLATEAVTLALSVWLYRKQHRHHGATPA